MNKQMIFQASLDSKYVNGELWLKVENLNLQLIADRMTLKHNWSQDRTALAITKYRQYLYLTQMCEQPITPTSDVDAIWHEHILHTNKYARDCELLFSKFLHHFPTPAAWTQDSEGVHPGNCQGTTNCGNDKPSDCSCSGNKRSMDYDRPQKQDTVATISFDLVKQEFFAF